MRTLAKTALAAAAALAFSAYALPDALAQSADSHLSDPRDLSGVWFITHSSQLNSDQTVHYDAKGDKAVPHSRVLWPIDHKAPPFTAWGQQKFNARFNGAIANEPIADPSTDCVPHGVPRIMIAPYPMQIIQTKGQVTMVFEVNHNVRYIPLNRTLPAHPKITMMGESSGHWEGDTFVIQTVGLSGSAIFDEIGTPHSDQLKVTERLKKIDGGKLLENTMTFEDPVAYSKPWTAREVMAWRPDIQLTEYVCEENNRNWSDASGKTTAK